MTLTSFGRLSLVELEEAIPDGVSKASHDYVVKMLLND